VYTYDDANRLTKVEKNTETLGEYVYDGQGRRIQVTEDGVTTTYIYTGLNVLYEENTTGAATYIYGPTRRLAKRTTINEETNTFYYHTDHLGSTRLVTDDSKNIVSAATYHPFGTPCTEEGSEEYLFTGQKKDSTGLYYLSARYYDPEVGRFITKDSWTYLPNDFRSFGNAIAYWMIDPQIFNRYSYCRNNPLKYSDPSGHGWLDVLFWGGLAILAIVTIPFAVPVILIAAAYFTAAVSIYAFIWCVYKEMTVRVDISYSVGDHVTRVDWFDQDGKRLGGWYEIYDLETGEMVGYNVWSTEFQDWVFVPENQWTPPPPPNPGEPTVPVTYEDIKDQLKNNPSKPGQNNSENSPTQGGTRAGDDNYAV